MMRYLQGTGNLFCAVGTALELKIELRIVCGIREVKIMTGQLEDFLKSSIYDCVLNKPMV